MARVPLNYGTSAGDGTGDILFDIFGDIETNTVELFGLITAGSTYNSDPAITFSSVVDKLGSDYLLLDTYDANADIAAPTKVKVQGALGLFTMIDATGATFDFDINGATINTSKTAMFFSIAGTDVISINSTGVISALVAGASIGASANQFTNVFTAIVSGGSGSLKVLGAGTSGVKVQDTTTDYLSFYGLTPVQQPSGTGETAGFTAGVGTGVNDDSTFTGNVGSTAYRISDIVKHLKNLGLIAS